MLDYRFSQKSLLTRAPNYTILLDEIDIQYDWMALMAKLIIQSVDRALEILRLVAADPRGVGLQSLARQMNLRAQTVHNIVNTLIARGYLRVIDKPVRYALGPEVYNLTLMNSSGDMNLPCETAARELSTSFPSATITLCQYNGSETGQLERPVNRMFSPYTSASSVAFSALASRHLREEYERLHAFDEYGTTLWKSREQFDEALSQARRDGYALLTHNGFRLAVGVFDTGNDVHSIIGVSLSPEQASGLDTDFLKARALLVAQWVRTQEPPEFLKETHRCS